MRSGRAAWIYLTAVTSLIPNSLMRWSGSAVSWASSTIRSKCRVLYPLDDSWVLPCIGSHCQTTLCPAAVTFSTIGGSTSLTRWLPIRLISVSRPGMLSGFSFSHSSRAASGVADGLSLTPTGFAMRDA